MAPFAEDTVREGMQQPIQYWVPSIAPSGMTLSPVIDTPTGKDIYW